MQVMREAAGDAYILACGAPIIPTLGLCDGIRIGPDVTPYWLNTGPHCLAQQPERHIHTKRHPHMPPSSLAETARQHRPGCDVLPLEAQRAQAARKQLLLDLGTITGFKATSDLPQWWNASEREMVREFLESNPTVEKLSRYEYRIDGREVDLSPAIPIPASSLDIPVWLARQAWMLKR
jgi:alpha-galactosidase